MRDIIYLQDLESSNQCVIIVFVKANKNQIRNWIVLWIGYKYVKAPTRRRPVQVFYNMLNLAGINTWVMFKQVHGSSISRRDYIIKLIEDILTLVSPDHVIASTVLASPPVKRKLLTENQEENSPSSKKRFKCQVKLCLNRNTCSYVCFKCQRQVCGSCAEDI